MKIAPFFLYLFFSLLHFPLAFSQNLPENYPFIDTDSNSIGNPTPLINKLNSKLNQNIFKIFVIGDSHTASGEIAESLNSNLQQFFGNGGSAQLSLNNKFTSYIGRNPIKINSGEDDYTGFELLAKIDSNQIIIKDDQNELIEIASYEKSESGFLKVLFKNKIPSFYISTSNIVPPILTNGIITFQNDKGIMTSYFGKISASLVTFNTQLNYIYPFITAFNPDLIIVNLGTNDCTGPNFNQRYAEVEYDILLKKLKKAVPNASFLLISPPDFCSFRGGRLASNHNVPIMREAIKKLSETNNISYWDWQTVMGGVSSMELWVSHNLGARDYIHFTNQGKTLIAELLSEAIVKLFQIK